MDTSISKIPASNPLVRALARWENEGGSFHLSSTDFDQVGILQHLGAAVVKRWISLPPEIQRDLFEAAVEMDDPYLDTDVIRQHIAVFLHQHKSDMRGVNIGREV